MHSVKSRSNVLPPLWVRKSMCWSSPRADIISIKISVSGLFRSLACTLKSPMKIGLVCCVITSAVNSVNSSKNLLIVNFFWADGGGLYIPQMVSIIPGCFTIQIPCSKESKVWEVTSFTLVCWWVTSASPPPIPPVLFHVSKFLVHFDSGLTLLSIYRLCPSAKSQLWLCSLLWY